MNKQKKGSKERRKKEGREKKGKYIYFLISCDGNKKVKSMNGGGCHLLIFISLSAFGQSQIIRWVYIQTMALIEQ